MLRSLRLAAAPLLACLSAVPTAARAESPGALQMAIGNPADLKIAATVRVRYEALDGQPRAGLNPDADVLAIRSTLLLEYRHGPWRIGGELNDSRAYWGAADGSVTTNDVNTFEPVQAYLGLDLGAALGKGSKLGLQAGRMTMNAGSRRFLSSDEYRNATQAYTGLRADFKGRDGTSVTLFYLLPQIHLPDDRASVLNNRTALDKETFDLALFGGVVSRPDTIAGAAAEIGYYRLRGKDAPGRLTKDRDLHTFTARLLRDPKPGKLDFELEGAWQTGRISASSAAGAARLNVDAGMVHAGIGYMLPGTAKAHAMLMFDWVSGDRPGGSFNRFDTLFGMRRGEWGPSGIFAAIGRANITAASVRLEAAPGKRLDAMLLYRAMWLASRTDAFSTTGVVDKTGASGRFAGHQIDSRVRYWLVPGLLRGEVNFDWIAKGRFLDVAPNAPRTGDAHYVGAALTASL